MSVFIRIIRILCFHFCRYVGLDLNPMNTGGRIGMRGVNEIQLKNIQILSGYKTHNTRNKEGLSHSLFYCVCCCLGVKGR